MTIASAAGGLSIRAAVPGNVPVLLSFIKQLAVYERLTHEVVATEELLHAGLFGAHRSAEAALGWLGETAVGFVLFFHNYSTFLSRPGLYIEDLFVESAYRRRGYGTALLHHAARLAVERGCSRLEWSVLDWNQPAIDFYKKLGAVPMSDWTVFRISGQSLAKLASAAR